MSKWTAPDVASIRGDNSRPLQKIFGSLTEYINNSELDDISDVEIVSPTQGQTISWDATNSLWKNTDVSVLTNLNANNLASGTVPSARVSGSYTGITGVGTITTGTWSGSFGAVSGANLTNLNASNLASGTLPSARFTGVYNSGITQLVVDGSNANSPQIEIGDWNQDGRYSAIRTAYGYLLLGASQNTNCYLRTAVGQSLILGGGTDANTMTLTGSSVSIAGSLSLTGSTTSAGFVKTAGTNNVVTIGDWNSSTSYSAMNGDNGYIILGSTAAIGDRNLYLRGNNATGFVRIGANGNNTMDVRAGNLSNSVSIDGAIVLSGTANSYQFTSRTTSKKFEWYSTNNDCYLYDNVNGNISAWGNTGIFYPYKGVEGTPLYGSYGSLNVYGNSGGWYGIVFPSEQTTWMSAANGQYFGCYRNNTTWNFYVVNGTFVPSDVRYKRDVEPLTYGMNLLRHIETVTFDPLTEDPNDDPETTVGRTYYGFTTQNILSALEAVGETRDVAIVDIGGPTNDSQEVKSDRQYLNHSALMAPMVKALQELDLRLQLLETA